MFSYLVDHIFKIGTQNFEVLFLHRPLCAGVNESDREIMRLRLVGYDPVSNGMLGRFHYACAFGHATCSPEASGLREPLPLLPTARGVLFWRFYPFSKSALSWCISPSVVGVSEVAAVSVAAGEEAVRGLWLLEAKSFDLAIVKTREDILKIFKNGREKSLRMGGGVLRKFSPLLPEPIAMCQAYSARSLRSGGCESTSGVSNPASEGKDFAVWPPDALI
ncbi:hypothetical protein Cgig2_008253 [Carnegiea gigantea]|uniref:Uncharacterized protein n=1 Tax=Carnegiea gigantea TaxID=171969 RepID=A0A9Q1L2M5_9CARY|nr:hypothetical protein Cgig2_008253 [Carnegiea gigantea]